MSNMDRLLEQFLHERRNLKNISPATVESYYQAWKTYQRYNGTQEISQALLNRWLIQMRQAGRKIISCNTSIRHINAFCNWLFQNKHLPERCRLSVLKTGEIPSKTAPERKLKKIVRYRPIDAIEFRIHTLFLFLTDTGARIGEVQTLTRDAIDLDKRLVRLIGKGRKERVIAISPRMCHMLRNYLDQHAFELVFCSNEGKQLSRSNLRRDFKKLQRALGVEFKGSFHVIRHTYAHNFVNTVGALTGDKSNSIFHLQKQLGHSNISTTRNYVELQPEDLVKGHEQTSLLTKLESDDED